MAWRDWAKSCSEPALQTAVRPASAASTSAAHHAEPRNAEASGEGRIAMPGRGELTTAPISLFHIAKRCSIMLKRPKTGTILALCQPTVLTPLIRDLFVLGLTSTRNRPKVMLDADQNDGVPGVLCGSD